MPDLRKKMMVKKTAPPPPPKLAYIRINEVSADWTEDDLLDALQKVVGNFETQEQKLSLLPACSGSTKTALLYLHAPRDIF
jgi:hypothetical protein